MSASLLTACSSQSTQHGGPVNPALLSSEWIREGSFTPPRLKNSIQLTILIFNAKGTVEVKFVPEEPPNWDTLLAESKTGYSSWANLISEDLGNGQIRLSCIPENLAVMPRNPRLGNFCDQPTEYHYEIRSDKLYLTPPSVAGQTAPTTIYDRKPL